MSSLFLKCLIKYYQSNDQLAPTEVSLDGCFTEGKQYLREKSKCSCYCGSLMDWYVDEP